MDGLLESEITPEGTITRTYNAAGEAVSIKGDNGDVYGDIYLKYDDLGRLLWRTDNPLAGYLTKYDYDAVGNLVELWYPQYFPDVANQDGTFPEVYPKSVKYTYDANGRLETVTDWNDRKTTYAYDRSGGLIRSTLPDGSQVSYAYDAASRLTGLSDIAPSRTIAQYVYALDAIGQRIQANVTEPLIPLPAPTENTFAYDAANQQVDVDGISQFFDSDGNLTEGLLEGANTTFQYDSQNRLIDGGGIQHRYSAEGHRIVTVHEETATETRYIVDPNADLSRVLEERKGAGTTIRYVYGLGLISREDENGGNYRVYHYDSRGSTVALTDESGTLTDAYSYAPFGQVTQIVGATQNPFRYNGRDGVMSDDNGLYYMRARFYHPEGRRFVGRDLLLGDIIEAQALNRYAFVTGNPIFFIDPLGLSGDKDTEGYIYQSLNQVVFGNYTNNVTALGTVIQIGLGFSGFDFIADVRDINYNLQHWKWSWSHSFDTGTSVVALVPIVGTIKYADEVALLIDVHGNSRKSQKAQHVYEIRNKKTGEVIKTGVSSGRVSKKGKSYRAENQIRKWGKGDFESTIISEISTGTGARQKALDIEASNAAGLRPDNLTNPFYHKIP